MALDQNLTTAILETVPVARLYVHPLNPRGEIDEAGIVALAENIRALGLIQNLAGIYDDDGRIGIVAGGRRLRALDLLGDDPRFAAILDACFAEKLAEAAEARRAAEGWKWARTFPDSYVPYEESRALGTARLYPVPGALSPEQTERYDALAERAEAEELDADEAAELERLGALIDGGFTAEQTALSGIVVYVGHDGALRTEAGLVRAEDRAEAEAAGLLAPSRHAGDAAAKPKSPISAALAEDLARVARGARQQAALRDPDLILDLLAFELSGRIGHTHAFGLRRDIVPNQPGTATGFALDARLTEAAPAPENPWDFDRAEAFRAFRAQGAEHTRAELVRHLAGLLTVADEKLGALIDAEAGTDIRAVWTPTAENFLGRVSGAYLDALWRELLDLAADAPAATAFAKLRKGEKAARLESLFADPETRAALGLGAEQEARVAAWLPPEAF